MKKFLSAILGIIVIGFLTIKTIGFISKSYFRNLEKVTFDIESLGEEIIPGDFPILIIEQKSDDRELITDAKTILFEEIGEYQGDDYTYVVSDDEEKIQVIKDFVREYNRSKERPFDFDPTTGLPWYSGFFVKENNQDKQVLKVKHEMGDDYVNNSWYEIDKKSSDIRPIAHQSYFGSGHAIFLLPVFVLVLFFWIFIVRFLYKFIKNKFNVRNKQKLNES